MLVRGKWESRKKLKSRDDEGGETVLRLKEFVGCWWCPSLRRGEPERDRRVGGSEGYSFVLSFRNAD